MFVKVVDLKEVMYTNQTGKFPFLSSKGNRYVMVGYHADANYIFQEAMKNRTERQMIDTYQRIVQRMRAGGLTVKKHILDNEISEGYKEAIKGNDVTHELVPPSDHRRNLAERAIQTAKNHFVGVIAGVHENFPMHLWCRLLAQAELQLNMQRQSNVTPKVSAYAHVHGPHNFMKKPFAPLGCPILTHDKPGNRGSWAEHASDGWHLGTSMEHHRCFNVWVKATRAERVTGTIFFKHKYLTDPIITPEDTVVAAAQQLTNALQGNVSGSNEQLEALKGVAKLFEDIAANKSQLAHENEITNNGIRTHPTTPIPRVDAPLPRVEEEEPQPRVEDTIPPLQIVPPPEMIVACPTDAFVPIEKPNDHSNLPNYISQDEFEPPARRTRSNRRVERSITQETILSCMEFTSVQLKPKNLASRKFPMQFLCEFAGAVMDANGELLQYRHLIKRPEYKRVWGGAYGKEVGRLAQGLPGIVEGTDTIDFIRKHEIPDDRYKDVTYGQIVCNYREEKIDPYRARLVVGGDRINYPGEVGTPTADLLTVKLLLNSIVSTPGAKFFTVDIKNFYLMTPLPRHEFLRLKLADMPDNVIEHYELNKIATADGSIYVRVKRGMYGLPQSGILAQELLEKRLGEDGYYQSNFTPGLWLHESRPISFSLCVDDFGVKYVGEEHKQHLLACLKKNYEITVEDEGTRYLGMTLEWDYINRKVHLTMPGYVPKALKRFNHTAPNRPQNQPYPHVPPNYGAKKQYAKGADESPLLDKNGKKFVMQVTGTFLYYARAIDSTMLPALSAIASEQSAPTENTMKKVKQFLDYAASQEEAILTYRASDMVLAIHSDASYLSERDARSRAGGHHFMSNNEENPPNNGAVLNISQIIRNVMSSAAEAELGALFINAKTSVPTRMTLLELGHPQPRTPIQTDNSTAYGLINNKILAKATKSIDMNFHWLRCRDSQGQFRYYWAPGTGNLADYWTKHHPGSHHQNFRPRILTSKKYIKAWRATLPKMRSTMARVC